MGPAAPPVSRKVIEIPSESCSGLKHGPGDTVVVEWSTADQDAAGLQVHPARESDGRRRRGRRAALPIGEKETASKARSSTGPARDIPRSWPPDPPTRRRRSRGIDFWHTLRFPRLASLVKFTDGPTARARRRFLSVSPRSASPRQRPSRHWDPTLVRRRAPRSPPGPRQGRPGAAGPPSTCTTPLWGRNFEPSPGSAATAKLAVAYIRGVQGPGRDRDRQASGRQRDRVRTLHQLVRDRRAHLRELYLLPSSTRSRWRGCSALMTSYNRVNGAHVPDTRACCATSSAGVGLRGLRHDRLGSDWRRPSTPPVPGLDLGDARTRTSLRWGAGRGGPLRAWWRRRSWTPRCGGCSPYSTASGHSTTRHGTSSRWTGRDREVTRRAGPRRPCCSPTGGSCRWRPGRCTGCRPGRNASIRASWAAAAPPSCAPRLSPWRRSAGVW